MTPESDFTARAYLLGELPDDRVAALEQALLKDSDLLDHVQHVEEDLVDDYVDDRLSADDRTRFEAYYLASQLHRDRVALSRALVAVAHETPHESRPAATGFLAMRRHTLAWASAAALLILVAGWLAVRPGPGEPGVEPSPPRVADTPSSSPAPGPAPGGRPPAESPRPSMAPVRVALLLAPVATRGRATTPRLVVPNGTAFIDLRLEGPRQQGASASAEIRSVDDRLAWTGTAASATDRQQMDAPAPAWVASVPADRLAADDYILTLSDARAQIIARYFFRIAREP